MAIKFYARPGSEKHPDNGRFMAVHGSKMVVVDTRTDIASISVAPAPSLFLADVEIKPQIFQQALDIANNRQKEMLNLFKK